MLGSLRTVKECIGSVPIKVVECPWYLYKPMPSLKTIAVALALTGASLTLLEVSPKPAKAYACDCEPVRQLPNGKYYTFAVVLAIAIIISVGILL